MLFLREYANFIKDELMAELADFRRRTWCCPSISSPVPTDVAVKDVQKKIMAVETGYHPLADPAEHDTTNFLPPSPMSWSRPGRVTKEIMDDITVRDQHMIHGLLTITHFG